MFAKPHSKTPLALRKNSHLNSLNSSKTARNLSNNSILKNSILNRAKTPSHSTLNRSQHIMNMANSKKMNVKSYTILAEKLQKQIIQILEEIDPKKANLIDFQQAGRLFTQLEIFQVINYNEKFQLTNLEKFTATDLGVKKRKQAEMQLHEQLWILFSNYELCLDYVQIEIVYNIMIKLLDPMTYSPQEYHEQAQQILQYLGKTDEQIQDIINKAQQKNSDLIPWSPLQMVQKFKQLRQTGHFFKKTSPQPCKQEAAILHDYKTNKYSHSPAINPSSLHIDAINRQKFIQENNLTPKNNYNKQINQHNNLPQGEFSNQRGFRQPTERMKLLQQKIYGHTEFFPINQDHEQENQNQNSNQNQIRREKNSHPFNYNKELISEYKQNFVEKKIEPNDPLNQILFSENIAQDKQEKTEEENKIKNEIHQSQEINENQEEKNGKVDVVDILYKKEENRKKKIQEQKEQKILEETKNCTFQPKINEKNTKNLNQSNNDLQPTVFDRLNKPKVGKDKVQSLEEDREYQQRQKELQELEENCHFAPQINQNKLDYNNIKGNVQVNGFEKNVGRMKYAAEQNQIKKQKLEHKPAGENYEKKKSQKANPPQMLTRPKKEKKPFLILEINIAPGKSGKLSLVEDDDAQKVAKNFCKQYDLNDQAREIIATDIQQQIDLYKEKQILKKQKLLQKQQKIQQQQQLIQNQIQKQKQKQQQFQEQEQEEFQSDNHSLKHSVSQPIIQNNYQNPYQNQPISPTNINQNQFQTNQNNFQPQFNQQQQFQQQYKNPKYTYIHPQSANQLQFSPSFSNSSNIESDLSDRYMQALKKKQMKEQKELEKLQKELELQKLKANQYRNQREEVEDFDENYSSFKKELQNSQKPKKKWQKPDQQYFQKLSSNQNNSVSSQDEDEEEEIQIQNFNKKNNKKQNLKYKNQQQQQQFQEQPFKKSQKQNLKAGNYNNNKHINNKFNNNLNKSSEEENNLENTSYDSGYYEQQYLQLQEQNYQKYGYVPDFSNKFVHTKYQDDYKQRGIPTDPRKNNLYNYNQFGEDTDSGYNEY
ncbi:hypothetical protein PPERSA_06074 [Pseudocohnilembus persalinus]|uniref:EF-hand domain-containing protein n=1 Tax=Pseudocohnilembus persalinus TaxID=266149 RepID=A0A0V0QW11_PSEPJ|nr:hypothetical protein PPERSA_06074 [Pseudocohnilembus persalinus]|eukprot:KRX06192.1 hypothetical protein PPERSA_06074 [Pseudocohnilembus persalinus]